MWRWNRELRVRSGPELTLRGSQMVSKVTGGEMSGGEVAPEPGQAPRRKKRARRWVSWVARKMWVAEDHGVLSGVSFCERSSRGRQEL